MTTRARITLLLVLLVLLVPCGLLAQTPPAPATGGSTAAPPQMPGGGGPPPGDPGRPPKEARFFLGLSLMALDEKAGMLAEAGQTDAAIAELKKVYAYNLPKDHPVYEVRVRLVGKLAVLQAKSGQKAEAVKTIQAMLADVAKGTPAEAAGYFEAGKAYRELKMTDEALKAFDKAIEVSDALAKQEWKPGPPPQGGGGMRPGGPGERPPEPGHSH